MQNGTPKDESVFDEKLSPKDTKPSHTLGIFKHDFGSDGKIKSTTFLRQFSQDEAARNVCFRACCCSRTLVLRCCLPLAEVSDRAQIPLCKLQKHGKTRYVASFSGSTQPKHQIPLGRLCS